MQEVEIHSPCAPVRLRVCLGWRSLLLSISLFHRYIDKQLASQFTSASRIDLCVCVCVDLLVPPTRSSADVCSSLLCVFSRCSPVKLNGSRNVTGVLRGFDQFMNLVLEDTVEVVSASERNQIGMCVLRGNSVLMIECLEKL